VLVVMGRSWTNSVDSYAVLIERAEASFNISQGRRWETDIAMNPDQFYAIRESFLFSSTSAARARRRSACGWRRWPDQPDVGVRGPKSRRTPRDRLTDPHQARPGHIRAHALDRPDS